MTTKKTDSPDKLDEVALQVLFKEYDTLRELYTQAEASAQGLFNFYLTLVSTVVGALLVLIQFGGVRTPALLFILLSFMAVIGSVYLSALVGRYAHMVRYARGIDALRRYLIRRSDTPTPHHYADFLNDPPTPRIQVVRFSPTWLFPTGTFQFFVTLVNSTAFALLIWLVLYGSGVTTMRLVASVVTVITVFLLIFTIYNIYAHWLIQTLVTRLSIRVDTSRDLPLIAGKQ